MRSKTLAQVQRQILLGANAVLHSFFLSFFLSFLNRRKKTNRVPRRLGQPATHPATFRCDGPCQREQHICVWHKVQRMYICICIYGRSGGGGGGQTVANSSQSTLSQRSAMVPWSIGHVGTLPPYFERAELKNQGFGPQLNDMLVPRALYCRRVRI